MSSPGETPQIDPKVFSIETLDDEIQADRQCTELLKTFAEKQVSDKGLTPLEAGQLAHGADPFLRDFMIANRRENLFSPSPGRVRQYAGHFYIINSLEPNRQELVMMLDGIEAFYRFCQEMNLIGEELLQSLLDECAAIDEYAARIESFWDLQDDGFITWRKEIPLD